MRIHVPIAAAALLFAPLAKADPPAQTLEGPSQRPQEPAVCDCLVGFAGPLISVSSVAGQAGIFVGGQGGAVLRNRFVLGAAGFALVNGPTMPSSANLGAGDHVIGMSYGGFWFGYIAVPQAIVHLTVGALIGGGSVSYRVTDQAPGAPATYAIDGFFQAQPEVEAEVNVLRFMRVALGAYYRIAAGVELEGKLGNSDVSGPGGLLLVKFGKY